MKDLEIEIQGPVTDYFYTCLDVQLIDEIDELLGSFHRNIGIDEVIQLIYSNELDKAVEFDAIKFPTIAAFSNDRFKNVELHHEIVEQDSVLSILFDNSEKFRGRISEIETTVVESDFLNEFVVSDDFEQRSLQTVEKSSRGFYISRNPFFCRGFLDDLLNGSGTETKRSCVVGIETKSECTIKTEVNKFDPSDMVLLYQFGVAKHFGTHVPKIGYSVLVEDKSKFFRRDVVRYGKCSARLL